MNEQEARDIAETIVSWHMSSAPLLEEDITNKILSAEQRGFLRGLEAAMGAVSHTLLISDPTTPPKHVHLDLGPMLVAHIRALAEKGSK